MKILAVFCAIGGFAGLSGVIYAEDFGSGLISFLMGALLFFCAYKLFKLKRKPKEPVIVQRVEKKPYNPYMDMSIFESDHLLEPIEYEDLFLRPNEAVYFAIPARTFKYSSKGRTVKSIGDYVLTNQRALFLGATDNFDIPLEKITSIKIEQDYTLTLFQGQKNYNLIIGDLITGVPYLEAEYTHLATTEVVKRFVTLKK